VRADFQSKRTSGCDQRARSSASIAGGLTRLGRTLTIRYGVTVGESRRAFASRQSGRRRERWS
jgi:hypothetical protein